MIRLDNVTKKYGEKTAVEGLSLEVKNGELCVLIGPSGCGKSTTLRMINRIIEPTDGDIYIDDRRAVESQPDILRRQIGYVIQHVGLFPHMTVYENIAVVPKLLKWPKKEIEERAETLMDLIGLDRSYLAKYPKQLSGGEAQRIGVARALAANPPILLMDEPFGAVDPLNRERLQNEFLKIQKQLKKTVVFVTHDVEEAIRLGDRIAIMNQGKLVQYDVPEAFVLKPSDPFVTDFLGSEYSLKILSRYRLGDIVNREVIEQNPEDEVIRDSATVKEVLSMMVAHEFHRMSVVDDTSNFIGTVELQDIMSIFKGDVYERA